MNDTQIFYYKVHGFHTTTDILYYNQGKIAIIAILATCALDRNTLSTCTPENASLATNGDNSDNQATYVADLSIDPVTSQADFSQSVPVKLYLANMDMVKENMQQLLDIILGFFESEVIKVENGQLKEEEKLLNDVQEDDTNTKHTPRSLPTGFKRSRAQNTLSDIETN